MKKIAVLIAALTISATTFAGIPFVDFGIKAGIESENMHYKSSIAGLGTALDDPGTGYHAGLVARVSMPLLPVFVQGELLYNWSSMTVTPEGAGFSSAKLRTNSFSVPVLLGVRFGLGDLAGLRLNAGPVFNLVSNSSLKDATTGWDASWSKKYADTFQKRSVTWTAGIGADLFGLMVDMRYNGAFKKSSNKVTLGNVDGKPTSWSLSVGYLF